MGLRNTYKHKVGPITVNFTKKFSPSSVTFRAAGVTYRIWSKRDQSGFAGVDLPGPWSWRAKAKRKQAKNNQPQNTQVQNSQNTANQ